MNLFLFQNIKVLSKILPSKSTLLGVYRLEKGAGVMSAGVGDAGRWRVQKAIQNSSNVYHTSIN